MFFPPLVQFPLWSNQGLDRLLPSPFQPSVSLILCRPFPLLGFRESLVKARVWLSREAAFNLLHRHFSWKLELGLRLGCLLFVEPGCFQDVIAQGKPSFLPGINKAA